jgi:hypothetical protein
LIRLGLPSGGEAGLARDYHLQYSGLCRSALFRSVSGGEAGSKSDNHLQYYELCKTVLFSFFSGGEAGPEGDYHLQYSGLCRSVLFVSEVKKAQKGNITPIFWTLQKCIV